MYLLHLHDPAHPSWTALATHKMRHIEVPHVEYDILTNATPGEPSHAIRAWMEATRMRQRERLEPLGMNCNADMGAGEIHKLCTLRVNAQALMRTAMRLMQ